MLWSQSVPFRPRALWHPRCASWFELVDDDRVAALIRARKRLDDRCGISEWPRWVKVIGAVDRHGPAQVQRAARHLTIDRHTLKQTRHVVCGPGPELRAVEGDVLLHNHLTV